ncbi:uncharacterized protein LOC115750145 [Rhodamnia argentea]|uniref:Uncharacterized protein LOC115750145 n=1 Tax=Rhodamnia argentea TaxID=178133 RepID=A0A8B8Q7V2_9MYRT|nr:uncharacterized protein LOC115750145 [Rhodamnia argentea]
MGNQESRNHSSSSRGGKVVLWDGTVHRLEDPGLTAAELMLEHPRQVVVEFDPKASGKRPAPLPADRELEPGKVYLMLPVKQGKPMSLSAEEARHVLLAANSVLRSRSLLPSSSRLLPLFAWMCILGDGCKESRPPPREGNREDETSVAKTCTLADPIMSEIMDGRPEYLSRQLSGKGWKPSLDTIKEKRIEKKVPYWLF